MADSSWGCGTIPEQGHQKPSQRFLNRHVRSEVNLKWYDLGTELLDSEDVGKLDTIEADHPTDHDKCCVKMFKLWLRKQPTASWNQLIEALRQPDIELHTLASKIEQMLLQPKPKDQPALHSVAVDPRQSALISVTSLNADFTSLLLNVRHILSSSPDEQRNLEICKEYCALLRINDSSNEPLLSAEKITKIKECCDFKQLFEIISMHMSWDEHSILTQIVNHCNSVEGQQEIDNFEKKMALCQGLQIISSTSMQNLSEEFVKFCVIINKPYKNVTIDEYKSIKAYICSNLNVYAYVTVGFIRMLYHSLHIEWLVTVQAVPHMIKTAFQNKDIFVKESIVFMQIGTEVVVNDEGTLAQLLSHTQMLHLKELQLSKALKERQTPHGVTNGSSTSVNQQMKYFEPSTVADEFSFVTEQVIKLFQSHDPKVLVEELEAIMASDKHGIKFLSDDQVEQLREYNNTHLLLQELGHLWSWSNHSMLRTLVGSCDEAIKLLDEFDCHLDPFEPITSYPVFEVIPTDATTQSILNIKFAEVSPSFTLQDVFDIRLEVANKCTIAEYCLQLLATQQHVQDLITVYWSIPKCIVNLIISKVLQHKRIFYHMGIVEVEIYPDIHMITGSITDLCEKAGKTQDLLKQFQHLNRKYGNLVGENQRLKQNEHMLLTSLNTRDQKCKELEDKCKRIQKDVEEKTKEGIVNQQKEYRELKVELEKIIKTLDIDAHIPVPELSSKVEEGIIKVATVAEHWQQLEYETNDLQQSIKHLKYRADKVITNKGKTEQQYKQLVEEVTELTSKLAVKESDIARLSDDNKLLLKKIAESSKQTEILDSGYHTREMAGDPPTLTASELRELLSVFTSLDNYRRIIDLIAPDLTADVNVDTLLPHLHCHQLINYDQKFHLGHVRHSTTKKALLLLLLLYCKLNREYHVKQMKQDEYLQKFVCCLNLTHEHKGHEEIADKLKHAMRTYNIGCDNFCSHYCILSYC